MKQKGGAMEALLGICMAICLFLLVIVPVGVVASFKEHNQLQEEMKADNCQSVSKVDTGKTIYCGKACWRKETREEFSCNSGVKVIVE